MEVPFLTEKYWSAGSWSLIKTKCFEADTFHMTNSSHTYMGGEHTNGLYSSR